MLQDNPYPTDNNPQGGWPPAPEPPGGTNPPSGGGYMPPEPPSMPPPVINPLGETNLNTTPMSPMSSGPDIDLGESSRKSPSKKLALILIAVLLLIGVVGGGAFALLKGPLAKKSNAPPIVNQNPQPNPETPPAPEPPPPPQQTNDDIRAADLNIVAGGLASYAVANAGAYPSTQDQLVHLDALATPCIELLAANFIALCPNDPAGAPAFYGYKSNGVSYEVTAKLDDAACARTGAVFNGSICLYKVSSAPVVP
ncbi:MAG: hypothetical protein A3B75_02570 [Candidatus Terrybacteria bacterium RIFCSPHIGHO2_02_FULL_43_14]|uniref:Uncharacterized protein n=1 Tax=Candidatus Terrybacteria bacterium RIFCSPHIGHO2_01_FULL_43_35 TaxID=1802361 RepID=A0A1G2PG14_9BACT|nr:MAG: hypothetical protein A2828_00195 [Candidatus Terrybacteria bacterium RIFCSPHIGHO2_01_FULL_43_35]OHA49326.1 MAG: hypothetical protein A3B75_02570 [Candidatus Terrybacteria bacterium RIFCSPHIGHO2_02_FULL_43_14]